MFFQEIRELAGFSNWPTAIIVRSLAVHWVLCVDDVDIGDSLNVKGLDHEIFEQPEEIATNSINRNRPGIRP